MTIKTLSCFETSERARRLNEALHDPFDNEERWAIIESAFNQLREDIIRALKNPPYGLTFAQIVRQVQ